MSGEAHIKALLDIIVTSACQAMEEYKKGGNDVPTIHSKAFHPMDLAMDNVTLGKAVRALEGACKQLCVSLAPPINTIIKTTVPFEAPCMEVAVRAKVADVLEEHPNGLHVDKLSKLVNLEKGKLARVLRTLASKGCFTEVKPNTFSNNRISLYTLSSSNSGAYARLLVEHFSEGAPSLYETMTKPEYATSYDPERTPVVYTLRRKGIKGNYFDHLKEDDDTRENFHRAMIGIATNSLSLLHYYPWTGIKTFCDVGAGVGAISRPLWKMYPHLKITHQDLPEALDQAKSVWADDTPEAVQHNQVEFVPMNFLEQSPVQGQDVYYLRQIMHDWPDAEAVTILRNVRKAMASHSRLLIHDAVLPPRGGDHNARSFGLHDTPEPLLPNIDDRAYSSDMTMWVLFNAKERTLDEFITLGSAAGLELQKIYDLAHSTVLEFKVAANAN